MLNFREGSITKIFIGFFFAALLAYGYFEAYGILLGPTITLKTRETTVHEALIHVRGTAVRISSISMNGRAIKTTEAGDFDEKYLLAPGSNHIFLDAKDKYNNKTTRMLEVMYSTSTVASSSNMMASSTAATSTVASSSKASMSSSSSGVQNAKATSTIIKNVSSSTTRPNATSSF